MGTTLAHATIYFFHSLMFMFSTKPMEIHKLGLIVLLSSQGERCATAAPE